MTATVLTFGTARVDISTVTSQQIGMAHKILSSDGNFYLVENSKGELDSDGNLIEYKVTYSPSKGFQCTCPAGQHGFAHCRNFCWHIRASVACEEEVKQAMAEQEALNAPVIKAPASSVSALARATVGYTNVDDVTLARVLRRSEEQARKPKSKQAPMRAGRGFSLLK